MPTTKQPLKRYSILDRIDNLVVLDTGIPKDITFDAEEYFDPIVGVSRPMD